MLQLPSSLFEIFHIEVLFFFLSLFQITSGGTPIGGRIRCPR
jgi:hypothetical protein